MSARCSAGRWPAHVVTTDHAPAEQRAAQAPDGPSAARISPPPPHTHTPAAPVSHGTAARVGSPAASRHGRPVTDRSHALRHSSSGDKHVTGGDCHRTADRQRRQWAGQERSGPGRIFPNSITRVVPASGWPSDWLTLANQRRKTQCGCRGLVSVMCSYCQSHTEGVVAWVTSGEALCYVHLLSVAAYGGHGRVMRSDKTAFSVTLDTRQVRGSQSRIYDPRRSLD